MCDQDNMTHIMCTCDKDVEIERVLGRVFRDVGLLLLPTKPFS